MVAFLAAPAIGRQSNWLAATALLRLLRHEMLHGDEQFD